MQLRHRLDRHVHLHIQRLGSAHVDDPALSPRPHQEARHLRQRGLGRRQPDPLRLASAGFPDECIEALQRQRQVRPPLGCGHRVDLVHDHPLGTGKRLPCARGQHQVQRLRGRDQDVRGLFEHPPALALRGVAGADPHLDVRSGGVGWVGSESRSGDALSTAPAGCARCRRRAPSTGTHTPGACGARRRVPSPADRAPTGTPPTSCPSRSAPTPARVPRSRSPATPVPAPGSAARKQLRTTRAPWG